MQQGAESTYTITNIYVPYREILSTAHFEQRLSGQGCAYLHGFSAFRLPSTGLREVSPASGIDVQQPPSGDNSDLCRDVQLNAGLYKARQPVCWIWWVVGADRMSSPLGVVGAACLLVATYDG